MPKVFEKECKVKVIQYGEHANTVSFFDALKEKISKLFKK